MAKLKVKGTIIKQTIASVLTAVAQITEFNHDGAESETYDATTIDTNGAGKEYSQTGYSEGGNFNFSIFYDVDLAGHQAITDLITTPADCVWSITFTDATPATSSFTSAGVGFSFTGAMNDGLKADVALKLTGLMGYTT
jgi:hypothetical protein